MFGLVNYEKARKAAKLAESQSALESTAESEVEMSRKPKPTKFQNFQPATITSDSSSDEGNEIAASDNRGIEQTQLEVPMTALFESGKYISSAKLG